MRVVIDTAVVVSALLFEKGRVTFLRQAWSEDTIRPLASKQTVTELLRVLGYPKFQLNTAEVETALAACLPFAETVVVKGDLGHLPQCSDPHDQMFVELAHVGRAEALITGDRALLELASETEFEILAPRDFKERL